MMYSAKMFKLSSLIVLLLLFLKVECLYEGDTCYADDIAGVCTSLEACRPLYDEVKRAGSPMPLYIRIKLQALTCGFNYQQPLVCCQTEESIGGNNNWPVIGQDDNDKPNALDPSDNRKDGVDKDVDQDGPRDIEGHPNLRLLSSSCGNIDSDRIIGGDKTNLYEMPWMVLLSYDTSRGPKLSCGGTLINEWYVLTAAHCVTFLGNNLRLDGVILGEYDVRTDPDCERSDGVEYCAPNARNASIASVIAHPGYRPQTLFDDIALIRLAEPADFNLQTMKAICLPITKALEQENLTGKNVSVAGWGVTEDGLQSPVLLSVDLPVISNQACQDFFNGTPRIGDSQMCAGGVRDKDSCAGDSGGPLMYPGIIGAPGVRYVQRGIVSFGSKRCGIGGFPGVYTRVANYMDWILDNIHS